MSRSKPSYAYPDSFSWGVFITVYGDFPHPCYFCQEQVEARTQPRNREAATVHHVDHDRWNNAPGNLAPAHNGCHVGYHGRTSSQDTREKRAAANRGKQHSPEWCAKTSAAWDSAKRANASERARTAIAEGRIPLPPSHTGKKRSPETRRKMSAAQLGHAVSTKARENMSAAHKGKPLSREHRAALSAARKGRLMSPLHRAQITALGRKSKGRVVSADTRAKISAANRGKQHSPEARARMSEAAKRGWAKRKEQQMAISGQDAYGNFVDTGIGTAVTPRASVEVETHQAAEIETGSKFLPPAIPASHTPHRSPNSPR